MSSVQSVPGIADYIELRGCIEMQLRDPRGEPIPGTYRKIDNTVVTAGRRWILSRLKSTSPATETISHIAVGTGTTAPTTGDSSLQSESTRIAVSAFTTTGMDSNPPSWRAECQFATDQANTTLGEIGLFNSSASGTMTSRVTFTTINKTTSNTLSVSYTISN